jgi:hypothetical protein
MPCVPPVTTAVFPLNKSDLKLIDVLPVNG